MSPREKRHRSYFVSGGAVEQKRPKVVMAPVIVVENPPVENCRHGLPIGRFCLPCADESSLRDRIDVV